MVGAPTPIVRSSGALPGSASGAAAQGGPTRAGHGVETSGPTVSKPALAPQQRGRRVFGLGLDIGMPDGLNLGLVLAPTRWMRIQASAGTNSAAPNYRGGLSFVPVGWGPSFTFEVGRCTVAEMNGLLNSFFGISKWVKPYVQEFGYTYANAHLGFDHYFGNWVLFLHGGYTYLRGTVRGTDPVVVGRNSDQTPNMTVSVAEDAEVRAHTLSAKLGLLYMFAGGS